MPLVTDAALWTEVDVLIWLVGLCELAQLPHSRQGMLLV